jgi:hypothetical protein
MDNPRLDNLSEHVWETFHAFSEEARKLRVLVEQLSIPMSSDAYDALLNQRAAEGRAYERYLELREELFAYLKVSSQQGRKTNAWSR